MIIAYVFCTLSAFRSALSVLGAAGRVAAAVRTRSAPSKSDMQILGIEEMPSYNRI